LTTIGIRAEPSAFTFAIYDPTATNVVNIEEIRLPLAFTIPDRLKYARSNLLDVLREYGVEKAGVRITEPNAQRPNFERIQLEGVIQEAFASSTLTAYFVGQISSIAARLGRPRTELLPFIAGTQQYPGVSNWAKMSPHSREALLCAMAAVDA
jgi:hypothetical protein